MAANIHSLPPGWPANCMYASYLHQSGLFDEHIMELIRDSMLKWRHRMKEKLEEVVQQYPPRQKVDLESLADMLLVIFEGPSSCHWVGGILFFMIWN